MVSLTFLFIFGFIYTVGAQTLSIPIRRGKSALKLFGEQNIHPQMIERMFLKEFGGKNNGTDPVPLFKYLDWEYYAEVQLGQPGQKIRAILDTTWGVSWATAYDCPITSIGCLGKHKYDPNVSAVSNNTGIPFNLIMYNSSLSGTVYQDKFTINQASINYTFASCNHLPWMLYFSEADMILGMGYKNLAGSFPGAPLVYEMVDQKAINESIFSIYFNRESDTTRGGTLFIGGVESRHYRGNFSYVKAPKDEYMGFWAFQMDRVTVKTSKSKYNFCEKKCTAIVDSGENIIQGPLDEIKRLNEAIGARHFYFGRYSIPCAQANIVPKVHFFIGGRDFTVKGSELVQKISWGPTMLCLSVFKSSSSNDNIWFLGGPFLSTYYTTYDITNERIGFAQAL